SKDAVALLLRSLGNHGLHLRAAHSLVYLRGVREPRHQLLRCRTFGKQMGKDFLRRFGKELTLLVAGWLVKRGGNRLRLSPPTQLFGGSPIGAAVVEWVQYDVPALGIKEALNELAGRVVDDGRVAAALNLAEDLHDERGFARAGVAHQLDVLRLSLERYTHHLGCFGGLEADAVSIHRLVELPGRKHDRSLEATAVLQFLPAFDVFHD